MASSRDAEATDDLRPNQYEVPRSPDEQIEHMIEDCLDLLVPITSREAKRSILNALCAAVREAEKAKKIRSYLHHQPELGETR